VRQTVTQVETLTMKKRRLVRGQPPEPGGTNEKNFYTRQLGVGGDV